MMMSKGMQRSVLLALVLVIGAVHAYGEPKQQPMRTSGGCCKERSDYCANVNNFDNCVELLMCTDHTLTSNTAENTCQQSPVLVGNERGAKSLCSGSCNSYERAFCREEDEITCKELVSCRGFSPSLGDCKDGDQRKEWVKTLCEGTDDIRCDSEISDLCADKDKDSCTAAKNCADEDAVNTPLDNMDCDDLDADESKKAIAHYCGECDDKHKDWCKEMNAMENSEVAKDSDAYVASCTTFFECVEFNTALRDQEIAKCETGVFGLLDEHAAYCNCGLPAWQLGLIIGGAVVAAAVLGAACFFVVVPKVRARREATDSGRETVKFDEPEGEGEGEEKKSGFLARFGSKRSTKSGDPAPPPYE